MILIAGIPSERPIALAIEALTDAGVEHVVFNQRSSCRSRLDLSGEGGAVGGTFRIDGRSYPLEGFTGVYARLMDDRLLPELLDEEPSSPLRAEVRALHERLNVWTQVTPATVVNRPRSMLSNAAKPFQCQLIADAGFDVAPTLVSNEPDAVLAFRAEHGRVIYKSLSGTRSVVRELSDDDLERLTQIRWCPTQFQAWVPGDDVRVHVVGDDVHATAIESNATDYRYAGSDGEETDLRPVELGRNLADRCRRLTRELGLEFSGIDLRIDGDTAVCFEVNASPGYSYYEETTGQQISRSLAKHLRRGRR